MSLTQAWLGVVLAMPKWPTHTLTASAEGLGGWAISGPFPERLAQNSNNPLPRALATNVCWGALMGGRLVGLVLEPKLATCVAHVVLVAR